MPDEDEYKLDPYGCAMHDISAALRRAAINNGQMSKGEWQILLAIARVAFQHDEAFDVPPAVLKSIARVP